MSTALEAILAAVRLIELLISQGKDPKAEIEKIHARYSNEAQTIADHWND